MNFYDNSNVCAYTSLLECKCPYNPNIDCNCIKNFEHLLIGSDPASMLSREEFKIHELKNYVTHVHMLDKELISNFQKLKCFNQKINAGVQMHQTEFCMFKEITCGFIRDADARERLLHKIRNYFI